MLIRGAEIFRREAVEFQRRRLAGDVVLKPDRPLAHLCAAFTATVLLCAAAFAVVRFPAVMTTAASCTREGAQGIVAAYSPLPPEAQAVAATVRADSGRVLARTPRGTVIGRKELLAPLLPGAIAAGPVRCRVEFDVLLQPAAALWKGLHHAS